MKVTPELLPLIEWWEKDGKQTVIYLAVAAVAVGGWYGFKNYRAAQKVAASSAFVNAYTTEELEEASIKFSGSAAGGALKLRLAKSYFDAGNYDQALAAYEELAAKAPAGFEEVPVVGKAQCLEAQGKFAEAQKAFDEFAAANTNHYLTLTAQLGAARCLCEAGDRKTALKRIEALKAANKDDEMSKARIEETEKLIQRFGKKASPAPVAKPAAKSAEKAAAKPAVKPAAPAAKSAVKPAAPVVKPAKPAAPAKK